jgi:hypothetical protein
MAEKSSPKGPTIIVAIIGVLGTIAAAVIANWDKLSGSRRADQQQVEQASENKAGSTASNESAASDGTEKDIGMDAAAPINLAGKWTDAGGYEYIYKQTGIYYEFNQYKNGQHISYGAGSLSGRHFEHRFSGSFGGGLCSGELSADVNRADSTCTVGPTQFKLRLTRSMAADE